MTTDQHFLELRRQPFLTEEYFEKLEKNILGWRIPYHQKELADDKTVQTQKDGTSALAGEYTDLLHLRYTAGEPIAKLAGDMDEVVAAWEEFAKAQRAFKKHTEAAIFWFSYRIDYLKAVSLLGLAILLRREDLLGRINGLCHIYRGDDSIYDELVDPFVPEGKVESDNYKWFHDIPYESAIDAIDSPDPQEQSQRMCEAVEDWYAASEGEPYHDTHKDITDEGNGAYYGYWCFELAALCFIHNIDDTHFRDHITYPKDLVDYARSKG